MNLDMKKHNEILSVRDIAILGVMLAALLVGKVSLNNIPNVELVSFFIILFTINFGWKTIYPVIAFGVIECIVYPSFPWGIMYLYVWPVLCIVTCIFRRMNSVFVWSFISGIYGLLYGMLCAITVAFVSGLEAAFAWWMAGVMFDIVHGVSNCIIMLCLYKPMQRVFKFGVEYVNREKAD